MQQKKNVTIQDIANKSGYSKTSVSFAFNSPERIGKEARERILEIAKELDYIPDPSARNFSLGKHHSIGFLLPQGIEYSIDNPYTVNVIRGLGVVCEERGYNLTIIPPLNDSIPEAVKNATVDGLITMGFAVEMGIADILRLRRLPVVAIDGEALEGTPSVGVDDEKCAYDQMHTVLEYNHRDIVIINLPDAAYENEGKKLFTVVKKRKTGYKRALEEFNLNYKEVPHFTCEATIEEGKRMADHILSSYEPTAIVAMSDAVAIGIIQRLKKNGIRVPEDVSVIGIDNIREGELIEPKLSTIDQPAFLKGKEAGKALFEIIDGKEVKGKITVPHSIVLRSSLIKR